MRRTKSSLYFTLGVIIVSTVVVTMSLYSAYIYVVTKSRVTEELQRSSRHATHALQKNIAPYIEAYAVHEYENLILNEMAHKDILAIIVEDYNMGEILGKSSYVSGKVRDINHTITNFDAADPEQTRRMQQCDYKETSYITSASGARLGTITVCSSDLAMKKQLETMLLHNFVTTIAISLLLVVTLFFTIRRFVLRPLSEIINAISRSDADGVPLASIPPHGSREISILADSMNHMISTVRQSKQELENKHRDLRIEQERFQLAVDGTLDGLWDWNLLTDEVIHSSRFETMLGYDEGELPDTIACWIDIMHPDDVEKALRNVHTYLDSRGEKPYENTFRLRTKTGKWRWITGRGKALFAQDGTPLRFVGFNTDITEHMKHQEAIEHSAKHDNLTHLPNRFLFNELIQNAMYRCNRNNKLLALFYIDLDGFKEINDIYGHESGDKVLITIAQRMKTILRQEDVIARLGGDEFVIAIADLTQRDETILLLERLLHDLKQTIYHDEHPMNVSASIGVTLYPQEDEIGPEALLRQADQAMYKAKSSGKNQYRFFNVDADTSQKEYRKHLETFQHALQHDELILHYQPKFDMLHQKVLGFEALLRWNHPEKGLLYPNGFLPLLHQETAIMLALGKWVFRTAFEQLSQWIAAGHRFTISINISAHEFNEKHTYKVLKSLLKQYPNISPSDVELEILETNALEDTLQAKQMIESFRKLGFNVALDDFGTGYSTLSYLKDLPVDTLKIDKSFVIDMLQDSASLSIIEAAIGLAQAFRCHVVAEGVESSEHGAMLLRMGCTIAQGYAISRALPAEQVIPWLQTYQGDAAWQHTTRLPYRDRSVLYAIVEHRQWLKMLESYIENPQANNLPELDSTRCRFGEWLRGEAKDFYQHNASLERITTLHASLHQAAERLIRLPASEQRHRELDAIRTAHQEVLDQLNHLLRNASKED